MKNGCPVTTVPSRRWQWTNAHRILSNQAPLGTCMVVVLRVCSLMVIEAGRSITSLLPVPSFSSTRRSFQSNESWKNQRKHRGIVGYILFPEISKTCRKRMKSFCFLQLAHEKLSSLPTYQNLSPFFHPRFPTCKAMP